MTAVDGFLEVAEAVAHQAFERQVFGVGDALQQFQVIVVVSAGIGIHSFLDAGDDLIIW